MIALNTVAPLTALPVATGSIKNHGDLMIVVYWISIKGFSPGRRVSTAIYGMIVVRISEEGNGESDGVSVVGINEGNPVGRILGEIVGYVEGDLDGETEEGASEGVEDGVFDGVLDGTMVGMTVGIVLGELDGCVLGETELGAKDG